MAKRNIHTSRAQKQIKMKHSTWQSLCHLLRMRRCHLFRMQLILAGQLKKLAANNRLQGERGEFSARP